MSIEDVKATPVKQNAESDVTPVVNVVSPTPTKDDSYNASSTPTTSESIRGLGTFNASHRVLYRGSLCFLNGETDISLEGVCFIAHYAPTAISSLVTSPLALALESQRGRPALNISSVVPLSSIEDQLDSSIDVRVYIHPQSLIARAYFEGIFCTEPLSRGDKRTSHCVRVKLDDLGDESEGIVIYAELSTNHSNGTDSCINTPGTLHIRAARLIPISSTAREAKRRPRPDDPLPRNPLLSVAPLSKSNPFAKKRRERSSASLGMANSDRARKMARIRTASSVKSDVFLEPPPKSSTSETLSRVQSLQSTDIHSGSCLDRPKMKDLKRSKSDGQDQVNTEEEDIFGKRDILRASVSNLSARCGTSAGNRQNMQPSSESLPPNGKPLVTVTPEEENLIRMNKESIKKAVVSGMATMGVTKAHVDFKEIYQCTTRGIALAFRHKMQTQRVEREEVQPYVINHLEMYIRNVVQDMK